MNIVITGASSGIGKAIAELFYSKGYNVHLSARSKEKLEILKTELQNKYTSNGQIYLLSVDLGKKQNVAKLSEHIKKCFKQIDVLVNNVGYFTPGNVTNEDENTLEKMLNVNLFSAYYLTKYLLPFLTKTTTSYIFNMCSIASLQAYNNGGSYSISKYALLGFSDNLRLELMDTNVKVCAICPGAVLTDSWKDVKLKKNRIMEAKDIADIIYIQTQLSPSAVVEKIILRPQQGDL